jgi:hypothetical protein
MKYEQITTSKNSLIFEILCDEFGCHLVEKAIKHKETYRSFDRYNPSSISEVFNELSYKW